MKLKLMAPFAIDGFRVDASRALEAPEYSSISFADPWDFKAENDLPLVENLNYVRFSNVRKQHTHRFRVKLRGNKKQS